MAHRFERVAAVYRLAHRQAGLGRAQPGSLALDRGDRSIKWDFAKLLKEPPYGSAPKILRTPDTLSPFVTPCQWLTG